MSENNNRRPRKKPTQERAKATVDAIYEAALQLFVVDNYSAVTTDKIAERAGVSIGTLYQYFPNKESILVGLWDQVFDAVVIGGTTYSLHESGVTDEKSAPEQQESFADGNQDTAGNIMRPIAGVYAGVLSGTVMSSTFINIRHQFDFQSTWTFDVGESTLKLVLEDLPVIDRIAGEGTVDPYTGFAKMVFQAPVMGKLPGTGRADVYHRAPQPFEERRYMYLVPLEVGHGETVFVAERQNTAGSFILRELYGMERKRGVGDREYFVEDE